MNKKTVSRRSLLYCVTQMSVISSRDFVTHTFVCIAVELYEVPELYMPPDYILIIFFKSIIRNSQDMKSVTESHNWPCTLYYWFYIQLAIFLIKQRGETIWKLFPMVISLVFAAHNNCHKINSTFCKAGRRRCPLIYGNNKSANLMDAFFCMWTGTQQHKSGGA